MLNRYDREQIRQAYPTWTGTTHYEGCYLEGHIICALHMALNDLDEKDEPTDTEATRTVAGPSPTRASKLERL